MKSNQYVHRACDWWIQNLVCRDFNFTVLLRGVPGRIRIPKAWNVRQPPQKEHLFYFVAEGEFQAKFGQTERRLEAGDFLWVPAGTSFHFWLPEGKGLTIHRFRLQSAPGKKKEFPGFPVMMLPKAWPCMTWMEQITAEINHEDLGERSDSVRLKGLLLCFFTELQRLTATQRKGNHGLSRAQKQKLILYAAQNPANWPGPADLAGHLQLSHDYFSRLFARSFGKAPRRWLMEYRIHLAGIRLVESTLNVSQISDEFGYQDVFLFSRQFKTVTGYSPMEFKRRSVERS